MKSRGTLRLLSAFATARDGLTCLENPGSDFKTNRAFLLPRQAPHFSRNTFLEQHLHNIVDGSLAK